MRRIGWIALLVACLGTASAGVVFDLPQRKASFWCWQPIQHQTPPQVKDARWAQSPIDRFVLNKLEKNGLTPAEPAERRTLIRRASFDLIGLPPTAAEVDAFVKDPSRDAFATVVDRLLASEHFGERWARHWMDVVRYGETRGHEFDPLIPNAWQYRDYLIRAFNADVPYNQFVIEHLAGDLLPHPRLNPRKGFNESILGTGFWFLGEEVHSPVDIRQDEADRMNNRIDTMTKAFLGLTVGCARCHDHKFDAISQKDFYALAGFTLSAGYRQAPFMSMERNREVAGKLDALRESARPGLVAALLASEKPGLNRVADYLLAARACRGEKANRGAEAAAQLAAARGLDPATLGGWIAELAAAERDPAHVLHPFALLGADRSADKKASFAAKRSEMSAAMSVSSKATAAERVILDYAADGLAGAWYSDGVAFGLRPRRAGEVIFGTSLDLPIAGIMPRAAAVRDEVFMDLHATRGNEVDDGVLGNWNRSGQSIRTPKVTLKSGRLWYLVRGAGRAYAAVDSHLVVLGPLHGGLLHQWPDDRRNEWRWVSHDLSGYAGERCEIEFSPVGQGDLQIARVVEAPQSPAVDPPNALLAGMLADPAIDSLDALARAYQKLFLATADSLAADTLVGSSNARDQAAMADLLVRRPTLFRDANRAGSDGAAKAFIDAQAALAAGIIHESQSAPAMWEGNGVDENLLIRGVAKNADAPVPRRFLEAIAGPDQKPYPADGSGRLRLARQMLDESDPFIARVMVNRVWEHLFGRGIVPTVDNFGVLGQLPTHPELLDYLADHFRTEQAWSIKKLIRSIMLSSTYQMSSKAQPAAEQADPQNLLLHHMPIRRLEAEAIRDAMLSVSGRLDPAVGGAPVEVHVTEFMNGRGKPASGPLDGNGRRSIYTRVRRNFLPPMMLAFDTPNPFACIGRRNVSNVPAQALILMNDPLVVEQANLWARHVLADPGASPKERIGRMFETALSREPRPLEIEEMLKFLDEQGAACGLAPGQRMQDPRIWADLCHVMFNMKEFVFVE